MLPIEQKKQIAIESGLMVIDTNKATFTMQEIENRRFLYSPQTGTLILGYQFHGKALVSSHAEEHGDSGIKEPYDNFLRGWIGTGKDYPDGVIHFAPNIDSRAVEQFNRGFDTLEMFARNGAKEETVVRGFGDQWEQPLSNLNIQIIGRSDRMIETKFSIQLMNRSRFEAGEPGGAWLALPATPEQLQEAMRGIGISADNPQDFFINGYSSPENTPLDLPLDLIRSAQVDELNFLAARLNALDASELAELNAIMQTEGKFQTIGQMIDYADNTDCYSLISARNYSDLGEYYMKQSGLIVIPEAWQPGIDTERLGRHISQDDHGIFTDYGYLIRNGEEWQQVYEGQPVPEQYRIMSFPPPQIDREQAAPELPHITPITLKFKTKDEMMEQITSQLTAGVQEIFTSGRYEDYLKTMSHLHSYSPRNTLLIAIQGGTVVAGAKQWNEFFQRRVKDGEWRNAIRILAYDPYIKKSWVQKVDPQTKQPVFGPDGKPVMEEKETKVPHYRIVNVYDVSQTEGRELPELGVSELAGSVKNYRDFFAAAEKASPYSITFAPLQEKKGECNHEDKEITINPGMSELQTIKTEIHEVAHARLDAQYKKRPDKSTREVQAESVAYVVCNYYGLDTSDYSFGYIAGWGDEQLSELRASLNMIQKTAHAIIQEMDSYFAELKKQREAEQTAEQPEPPAVDRAAEQQNPDSVFSKLSPEKQEEIKGNVQAMLQTLADTDLKTAGAVSAGTLEAIAAQGFSLVDGKVQREELAQEAPQPQEWSWNGYDGLINEKPMLEGASPTEQANALIDFAEQNGQRMGNEERGLVVQYSEAVKDPRKVADLINSLCQRSYEQRNGHVDERVKKRILAEIEQAQAAEQPEQLPPSLDPHIQPVVTITFSESPYLEENQKMPLYEANALFQKLDADHKGGGYYDKTGFRIDYTLHGELHSYEGRQDFGDKDGSLIEHIEKFQETYLHSENWKDFFIKEKGLEAWQEDQADRENTLNELIPYLKLHCNLSEIEQLAQEALSPEKQLSTEGITYFTAIQNHVNLCREKLNRGELDLPPLPRIEEVTHSNIIHLEDYRKRVLEEITQEAAEAGLTLEQYAANGYEAPQEPQQEPAPAKEAPAADEPQEATPAPEPKAPATEHLTDLQKQAVEIAKKYEKLPLQDKIDLIAQSLGCTTGQIETSLCTGKWRGTSDMSIRFDNGASLFIGNYLTPKAKTKKVQNEAVNRTLVFYNPEIISATKEAATAVLMKRAKKDNEIAAQKGLKPYTFLNVELYDAAGPDRTNGGYMGWYYVTLAVDGKIRPHMESGLKYEITHGKLSEIPSKRDYYTAGALKEDQVDYVFNNVGFSSASDLYSLPLRDDVRERAEKTLAEREAAAPERNDSEGREWGYYIVPDLKTWATNEPLETRSEMEHYATLEEAKARFEQLRGDDYNSEPAPDPSGQPYARLTLGVESKDGLSSSDILHVRAGQNYLVTDFSCMEALKNDPAVMGMLSDVSREIGFDRVRGFERNDDGSYRAVPDQPFSDWNNPYFEADTPGSIAAGVYELMNDHSPEFGAAHPDRSQKIAELAGQLKSGQSILVADALFSVRKDEQAPAELHQRADALMERINRYDEQHHTFSIYQVVDGSEGRDYRFRAYEELQAGGLTVSPEHYNLAYSAPLGDLNTLEEIYTKFNRDDRPNGDKMRSLSMGDVIVLSHDGQQAAYYVDRYGFQSVPEFLQEQALTPDALLTGEQIRTPRGSFHVTSMTREQMEAAGYGVHHQSDDGKFYIMGNGTDAFAVAVQPDNPLKAAEMTVEQNYNTIDGQINNTPPQEQPETYEQLSFSFAGPAQEPEGAGQPEEVQEATEQPQEEPQPEKKRTAADYYYSISEAAARRAKEMNSYDDYRPGSATAEYRHYIDEAFEMAERQKQRVDPMYHEKIDRLLDSYARRLAANMNHSNEIDARVPSILISGGGNFPVRKKEKQNAARQSNFEEWKEIQGLLDKIQSTGMGGIRQDDPQAIPKLQKKLEGLEKLQETMKAVNSYYRKHKTLDGCPALTTEQIEKLKASMEGSWRSEPRPFESYQLTNNNAEIRRLKQRIESLTRANEVAYVGWEFDGGHAEANREAGRLQLFFDGKPDEAIRSQLKENGFKWSPKFGAWQRLLNDNAYRAADYVAAIRPDTGEKPTELQRRSSREQRAAMREQAPQEEKPSILAQLREDKARAANAPKKEPQTKKKDMERE